MSDKDWVLIGILYERKDGSRERIILCNTCSKMYRGEYPDMQFCYMAYLGDRWAEAALCHHCKQMLLSSYLVARADKQALSDKDILRDIFDEARVNDNGVAFLTIRTILKKLYQSHPADETLGATAIYVRFIENRAQYIAEHPAEWVYKGRFSEALFYHHFIRTGDHLHIAVTIMGMLIRLDLGNNPGVESALDYLYSVVTRCQELQKQCIQAKGQ